MELKQIRDTIASIENERTDVEKCVGLLLNLQRDKGPLSEVVTVIKREKPLLYPLLKTRLQSNPGLRMLFDVTIDYEYAKNNLGM